MYSGLRNNKIYVMLFGIAPALLPLHLLRDYTPENELRCLCIADAVGAFEKEGGCLACVQEVPSSIQLERLRMDGPAGVGPDVFLMPHDQAGLCRSARSYRTAQGSPRDPD